MRQITITLLILFSICSYGQKENRFSLLLQAQPELTFHKKDYALRWTDKKTLATFNLGLNTALQYKLTDRFFIDFGLGFISRKLNTKVFVDQSLLPPPYYDSTLLLYVTKSVSFRMLEFFLGFGDNFLKTNNMNLFVKGLFVPIFILNTVAKDDYIFSQDDREIALTHKFLQLNLGAKINL